MLNIKMDTVKEGTIKADVTISGRGGDIADEMVEAVGVMLRWAKRNDEKMFGYIFSRIAVELVSMKLDINLNEDDEDERRQNKC